MSSVRHDWYQTDQKVVIDVLVKNAQNRSCTVDIQSNHVSVHGDDLILELDLEQEIDTAKSSYRILTVKIEITLHKLVGERWSSLTKSASSIPHVKSLPQATQSTQPSTHKKDDKNWDRLVKDVWEKEQIEKVNQIFEIHLTNRSTINI